MFLHGIQSGFIVYNNDGLTKFTKFNDKETVLLNSLPDDKILGLSKLKAFADNKSNVTQNIKAVFRRIENIVGKEENVGYRHFLLFPQCFQKAFSSSASKVVIVW